MVVCVVNGCKSRSGKKYNSPYVRFFSFPCVNSKIDEELHDLVLKRRNLWISRLARKDLTVLDCSKIAHSRICSKHFVSGSPAALRDTSNPDWAPSLNLGHDFFKSEDKLERKKRNYETSEDITEDNTSDMKDADEDEEDISAANESESMDEDASNENCDKSGQDRLKYFIFGSNEPIDSNQTRGVSHEDALSSAETLLHYMENQDGFDQSDHVFMRNLIEKIKEKALKD